MYITRLSNDYVCIIALSLTRAYTTALLVRSSLWRFKSFHKSNHREETRRSAEAGTPETYVEILAFIFTGVHGL